MSQIVTWEELAKHNKPGDYWMALHGKAYNVTKYLAEHPGGDDILIKYAGKDGTKHFDDQDHSEYAKSLRIPLLVGKMETEKPPVAEKDNIPSNSKELREITYEELAKHNTTDDCWLLINGIVYKPSAEFIDTHPGGPSVILKKAGKDATKSFEEVGHSEGAKQQLLDMIVGRIKPGSVPVNALDENDDKISIKQIAVLIAGLCIGISLYFFFNR